MMSDRAAALQEDIKVKQRSLAHMLAGTAPPPLTPPWIRPKTSVPQGGQQRIANASVTPPAAKWGWACVPGDCQPGKSAPCGMMHPATHRQCFRCSAIAPHVNKTVKPNLPKGPVATEAVDFGTGTRNPGTSTPVLQDVAMGFTCGEADIKEPLDTICSRIVMKTVTCPDVSSLIATLTNLAKDDVSDGHEDRTFQLQEKIQDKETELATAQLDKQSSANLSDRMQKLVQHECDNIEKELMKLRSQCSSNSNNATLASFSLAELDKKRAIAIASKESWQTREHKKSTDISARVNGVLDQISDAEEALELQKQHILDLQQSHKNSWSARQTVILKAHDSKISELVQACEAARPNELVAPDVKQLRDALDEAKLLLATQQEAMIAADVRYKEMEARINALTATNKSADEQSALINFGNGARNPGTPTVEVLGETTAELSSTGLTMAGDVCSDKGKGKGKDNGNANY